MSILLVTERFLLNNINTSFCLIENQELESGIHIPRILFIYIHLKVVTNFLNYCTVKITVLLYHWLLNYSEIGENYIKLQCCGARQLLSLVTKCIFSQ